MTQTSQTPFRFLSPQQLCGLAAFFAADKAARSVVIGHRGVAVTVTRRDLRLIHQLDANRFGDSAAACPLCLAEVG